MTMPTAMPTAMHKPMPEEGLPSKVAQDSDEWRPMELEELDRLWDDEGADYKFMLESGWYYRSMEIAWKSLCESYGVTAADNVAAGVPFKYDPGTWEPLGSYHTINEARRRAGDDLAVKANNCSSPPERFTRDEFRLCAREFVESFLSGMINAFEGEEKVRERCEDFDTNEELHAYARALTLLVCDFRKRDDVDFRIVKASGVAADEFLSAEAWRGERKEEFLRWCATPPFNYWKWVGPDGASEEEMRAKFKSLAKVKKMEAAEQAKMEMDAKAKAEEPKLTARNAEQAREAARASQRALDAARLESRRAASAARKLEMLAAEAAMA